MKRKHKKGSLFIKLLLIVTLVLPLTVTKLEAAMPQLPDWSYGSVVDKKESHLGQDATYSWYDLFVDDKVQKVHTVEFDPANANLKLVAGTKSGYVSGMTSLTKMAEQVDSEHHRVIAGINADFYEISGHATGVPNGIFISDGVVLTNDRSSYAFGLKADGSSIYGQPQLTENITIGEQSIALTSINRFRDPNQLVLFTSDYGVNTGASNDGVEVVLTVESGELTHGQEVVLIVEEVQNDAGKAPLAEGKMVLSASGNKEELINTLAPGDKVTAQVTMHEDWADVVVAVGGNGPLVKDGVAYNDVTPAGVHPRTAIGTKADGSILFFEVDGRQPGFSEGLETGQVAELLVEMGVVDAMNLDGGGSSTMIAKLPGSEGATMVNSGSDGYERSVGNGLLLVNTGVETGVVDSLAVTPNTERVLVGSSIELTAAGLDENMHPANAEGGYTWTVDEQYGSINETGRFTAGTTAGEAEITVTNGNASGGATIEIVDSLTDLRLPFAEKTYDSGQVEKLVVTAIRDGQVVQADASAFTWEVAGDIGTIDENGLFTATTGSGQTGLITVSFGEVSTAFIVNVGIPPVILEDFEGDLSRYKALSGANYNTMSLSIEHDQDYVRSGNSSLKLDYDFIGKSGTSGAYLDVKSVDDRIEIPGYPTKIGMWVYGDNKKHWLRAQLRDGNGAAIPINFTGSTPGLDWEGWKYVEAEVPAGRTTPLTIDMPVRYMETSNANKTDGTLYIDDIRAVYGPLHEDYDAPIITSLSPAENELVKTGTPTIKVTAQDADYDSSIHTASTLIDESSIRFYIDGEQITDFGFYKPRGELSYIPTNKLSEGRHVAKYAVRDASGNQVIKEWVFSVNLGSPYFTYEADTDYVVGGTHSIELAISNAAEAESGTFKVKYPVTADAKPLLENFTFRNAEGINVKDVSVDNDPVNGYVSVHFGDLTGLSAESRLGQLQYEVNPQVMGPFSLTTLLSDPTFTGKLDIIEASIERKDGVSNDYFGDSFNVNVKPELKLTWHHNGTFKGEEATLVVANAVTGEPVEGVQVHYNGAALEGATNAEGQLKTSILTETEGTFTIQAQKDTQYSALMSFVVAPFTGENEPSHITVTMGDDATSARNATWHTHPSVTSTKVELVESSQFTDFDADNVQVIEGSSELYTTDINGTYRVHRVQLTELKPGTAYTYRVGDGDQYVSAQGSFKTAAVDQEEVNMLFFGDSQAGNKAGFDLWEATVDAAYAQNPDVSYDLMIHSGDMVDKNTELNEWKWWFGAAQAEFMNTTLLPTIGNHEVIGNNGAGDYLSFFTLPKSGLKYSDGINYSFTYGDVHIAVLNTEFGTEGIVEQAAWLEEDLKNSTAKWKMAVFHQGPYGSTYANGAVQQHWVPLFDKYGVDLVMTGHDHIYLRSQLMAANEPVADGVHGTTYLIGGSSGPKFYGLDDLKTSSWREVVFDEQTQIYTSVSVTEEEIEVLVKTVAGEEVDKFSIAKTAATSLDISENARTLDRNITVQLTAKLEPVETTANVKWSIASMSAADIAELTAEGQLTTLKAGKITVVAEVLGQPELSKELTITIRGGSTDGSGGDIIVPDPSPEEENKVENGTLIIGEHNKVNSDKVMKVTSEVNINAVSMSAAALENAESVVITTPTMTYTFSKEMLEELAADKVTTVQLHSSQSEAMKSAIAEHYGMGAANVNVIGDVLHIQGVGAAQENEVKVEVQVQLTLPANVPAYTAGLYEVTADGKLLYAGGIVDDGKLVATVSGGQAYVVASLHTQYADVSATHWAKAFIEELSAKQIVEGVRDGEFDPSREVTRAEFTAMLARALQLDAATSVTFTDVSANSWYYDAVAAAVQAGIVNGKTALQFAPNAYISREEMAVMLMRAYQHATGSMKLGETAPFSDMDAVSDWAKDSVAAAYEAGFISGKTAELFDPSGNGTRAESAKLLLKLYQAITMQ